MREEERKREEVKENERGRERTRENEIGRGDDRKISRERERKRD